MAGRAMPWPELRDRLERTLNRLRNEPEADVAAVALDVNDLEILLTALTEYQARRDVNQPQRRVR